MSWYRQTGHTHVPSSLKCFARGCSRGENLYVHVALHVLGVHYSTEVPSTLPRPWRHSPRSLGSSPTRQLQRLGADGNRRECPPASSQPSPSPPLLQKRWTVCLASSSTVPSESEPSHGPEERASTENPTGERRRAPTPWKPSAVCLSSSSSASPAPAIESRASKISKSAVASPVKASRSSYFSSDGHGRVSSEPGSRLRRSPRRSPRRRCRRLRIRLPSHPPRLSRAQSPPSATYPTRTTSFGPTILTETRQ
eukprot:31097-Pelagococcus_subviridis.AAC.2